MDGYIPWVINSLQIFHWLSRWNIMDNTTQVANDTGQSDVIFVGIFSESKHPALLWVVIFVVFLIPLSGNTILIFLIHSVNHLHTPMYIFISQLSLMDMMYISVTVPEMLIDQVIGVNNISAPKCGMQIFCYVTLRGSRCFLLAAMAYDHYMAICYPLHYCILMNHKVCILLAFGCWFLGSLADFMLTCVTITLAFWKSWVIHHFFCEVPAVMNLSCSDSSLYETIMYFLLCPYASHPSNSHFKLLFFYPAHYPKYELSKGPKEGLNHFFLPYDCGHPLLWVRHLQLYASKLLSYPWEGHDGICLLYHTHSCAKSFNL